MPLVHNMGRTVDIENNKCMNNVLQQYNSHDAVMEAGECLGIHIAYTEYH